jgi:hypothetical protein
MSAIFEMTLPSETLSDEEVSELSGCSRKTDQVDWLTKNGWVFLLNRAGAPKIGRLYARLRLTGINPATLSTPGAAGWSLDTTKVR